MRFGLFAGPAFTDQCLAYRDVEGQAFHGDVVLGWTDEAAPCDPLLPSSRRTAGHVVVVDESYRWPDAVVPIEIAPQFSAAHVELIEQALREYEWWTKVRFVRRSEVNAANYPDYVSVVPVAEDQPDYVAGRSPLGRRGGRQLLELRRSTAHPGPSTYRAFLHELGHTLGLLHEHTRADRDEHLEVRLENILPEVRAGFERVVDDQARLRGPYDYLSVMHYGRTSGSVDDQDTLIARDEAYLDQIGKRPFLSDGDIAAIDSLWPELSRKSPPIAAALVSVEAGVVSGWACDRDHLDRPLTIRIGIGRPTKQLRGESTPVHALAYTVTADVFGRNHSSDAPYMCRGLKHGFTLTLPDWQKLKGQPLFAYVVPNGNEAPRDPILARGSGTVIGDAKPIGRLFGAVNGLIEGLASDPDDPQSPVTVEVSLSPPVHGRPLRPGDGFRTYRVVTTRIDDGTRIATSQGTQAPLFGFRVFVPGWRSKRDWRISGRVLNLADGKPHDLDVWASKFTINPVPKGSVALRAREVVGWACEGDVQTPITVRVRVWTEGSTPFTKVLKTLGTTLANLPTDARVAERCGGAGSYGYRFPIDRVAHAGKLLVVEAINRGEGMDTSLTPPAGLLISP